MTTTVGFEHNVPDLVEDIDDIKRDLRTELRDRVNRWMKFIMFEAKDNLRADADASGQLLKSMEKTETERGENFTVAVEVGGEMAPYAALVELGTGPVHSNEPFSESIQERRLQSPPADYPFDTPSISAPDNPGRAIINRTAGRKFYGFAMNLVDWMKEKGIEPKTGNYLVSAAYIAKQIIDKGQFSHPFLRPAWFQYELQLKNSIRYGVKEAFR